MKEDLLSSIKLCFSSLCVFSGAYALIVLLFAMVCAPDLREGSLIMDAGGTVRGSRLVGQTFTQPEYFWPRPSAVDYNAAAACGSNLSPVNPAVMERASAILAKYQIGEGKKIPADLVTTSGSGLDPHISLSAVTFQVERIATSRHLPPEQIKVLIDSAKDSPTLEWLGGEPVVNVLLLNLALDGLKK
jgi:potassium-transporting ATPase KdpC subunit